MDGQDFAEVERSEGERWRVEVYAPGSRTAELVVTSSGAAAGEDAALDDARHAVDRLLDAGSNGEW